MSSLIGLYLSFFAMLLSALLTLASYDLYDPDLFAPEATDSMDESFMLAPDTSSLGGMSMLDMPVDSNSLETSSAGLDGLAFDFGDSSMFDDPGSVYLSSSCISDADATPLVGTSKVRREDANVCTNPGTTGNAPTAEQKDEPPLKIPNLDDLPSLVDPLVLPADPPEDKTKCPPRFPARLCCQGPLGALERGFYYVSVANCKLCK